METAILELIVGGEIKFSFKGDYRDRLGNRIDWEMGEDVPDQIKERVSEPALFGVMYDNIMNYCDQNFPGQSYEVKFIVVKSK